MKVEQREIEDQVDAAKEQEDADKIWAQQQLSWKAHRDQINKRLQMLQKNLQLRVVGGDAELLQLSKMSAFMQTFTELDQIMDQVPPQMFEEILMSSWDLRDPSQFSLKMWYTRQLQEIMPKLRDLKEQLMQEMSEISASSKRKFEEMDSNPEIFSKIGIAKMSKLGALSLGAAGVCGMAVLSQMPVQTQLPIYAAAGLGLKICEMVGQEQMQVKIHRQMQVEMFEQTHQMQEINEQIKHDMAKVSELLSFQMQSLKVIEFGINKAGGNKIRQGMKVVEKLSYLEMRMMNVTLDDPEVIRQIGQGLEGASDAEQMVEDIAKIGELWISARVRCQDIAPKMLRAQWAKMVQEAVDTQIKTINGKLEEIKAKDGKIADMEYWEKQMSEIDKVSKKSWAEVLKRLADP